MTVSPRAAGALYTVVQQLAALNGIAKNAESSGDARLGFERLGRWKTRTARLLSERVHPNEGQKLGDVQTFSFRTYGNPLENLLEAVRRYSGFLVSLSEELEKHPEDVLDVPIPSSEKATAAQTPQPTSKGKTKETDQLLLRLFDSMQFHPKTVEASRKLFKDGHYSDAVFRAFTEVNNFVKVETGQELDGKALMSKVFRIQEPIIKLNKLKSQSDRDEQEGFMFLFMGAMVGIRNPKAHDNIVQKDALTTLEYLALASLLMKRAEEGSSESSE